MEQLQLLSNDDNVSFMLPYMKDEFPMSPEVAKFLQSYPTWDVIMDVKRWMEENLPVHNEKAAGLRHYFSDGTYTRECPIPGGQFIVGKKHKKGHVTMLMYGDATIITPDSQERVKGPRVWVDDAGVQRAIYTHSDCLFVTVHSTTLTDINEIERELIEGEE